MEKLLKNFGTNTDLENDGAWEDFGDGIRVKIRRLSSDASLAARREAEKPYLAQIRKGKLSDEAAEDIANKQLAWGVIADWEGCGEATRENKLAVMEDKRLRDFKLAILNIAADSDAYKIELDEEAEKN